MTEQHGISINLLYCLLLKDYSRELCSFASVRTRVGHVITTIIPPVNVGMAVTLGVVVVHLWAVKYWRILCIAFQEKKVRQEVQPQLMQFESSTVKRI